MYNPWTHAEELGLWIRYADLSHGDEGRWYAEHRTIALQRGLSERRERWILTHEVGHAYLDHPSHRSQKHERQADEFALTQLIHGREFGHSIYAEIQAKGYEQAVADALGIPARLFKSFRFLMQKDVWAEEVRDGLARRGYASLAEGATDELLQELDFGLSHASLWYIPFEDDSLDDVAS